jgi:hypothetical protein
VSPLAGEPSFTINFETLSHSRHETGRRVFSSREPASMTLERACDVLRLFTPQKPRWTISELARHLDVPKSGIFRLVKTFERKNFLQSSEDSYEYELGSGIWELTGTVFGKRERLMVKHLDCQSIFE